LIIDYDFSKEIGKVILRRIAISKVITEDWNEASKR
jgi:hypothetical protein